MTAIRSDELVRFLPDESMFRIACTTCGTEHAAGFVPFCEGCGQHNDVYYDLSRVRLHISADPYVRYRELLPLNNFDRLPSQKHFTPTVHASGLGAAIGIPGLYLKNETVLPTRSTKDRMAAIALAFLYERGVRAFCTSSTGNSSSAYAHAIRKFPDLRMYVFTASDFRHRVQYTPAPNIVHYVLEGASFVEAFEYSARFANRNGLVSERGFFNPGRREGLKLAFLEAVEQLDGPIDWYVQAVSSAMGVYGTYKGAREMMQLGRIERPPRLLCAQQQSCAPLVRAFESGADEMPAQFVVPRPAGIAEAILRGNPTRVYPIMKALVQKSRGTFTAVDEDEIRAARRLVEDKEGISPCFSASTAVAGLMRCLRAGTVSSRDTVLVNLTGGDRASSPHDATDDDAIWLKRTRTGWSPADPGADPGVAHDG